jgi:hypothetical protein
MEYGKVKAINNSKLGEVKRILAGEPAEISVKKETLELGRQLHLSALQYHLYNFEADPFAYQVKNMTDSLKKNLIFYSLITNPLAKFEYERYWTCRHSGVRCKAKYDGKLYSKIYDLKTTSCQTLEEFINSLKLYDYDRQAAFYLDGDNGEEFIFIGVQKKWPFKTFTFSVGVNDPWLDRGREEYIFLTRKAISMGIISTKYKDGGTDADNATSDEEDFFCEGIIY